METVLDGSINMWNLQTMETTTDKLTHKEMTKHIRQRIKKAGIKASVSLYRSCGSKWIRVSTHNFEARFTEEEQRQINNIAEVNRLTYSQGLPIEVDIPFGQENHFVYHD